MKKIYYVLTVLLTTGLVSCSDFLKEENLSGITAENYYVDAAGYESLMNSCYASLRDIYESDPKMFEWGTDVTTRGDFDVVSGTVGDRLIRATQLNEYKTLASDNSGSDEFFTLIYAGIQRCNTAINKGNIIPGLSDSQKNKRIGEVRYIRTFYYYLLVENYGGVPIVQDEINTAITHFVPNTETEVYDFILADLNASVTSVDATTTDFGRVNQGAVKHLLSLIYLTKGYKSFGTSADFTKSAQFAEEVISGGTYTLLPSFADVFRSDNQKNKEIIFSVQYDAASLRTKTIGNGQNVIFGWRIFKEPGFFEGETALYNRRTSDFMPTQYLYTLYDTKKDARYDATFLSQFYAVKDDKLGSSTIKKGDLRFFFPKPDQAFTAQDSIALKTANPNVEIIRFNRWKQDYDGIGGALKFPMVNKFFDPAALSPGTNSDHLYTSTRDVVLARLAETYLIAAEAYFKAGQLDKAAEKLNAVRQRATLPGQTMTITASSVTLDFILDERARELEGEYKRWLDLKRTHKLNRAVEQNILTKLANPAGIVDKYYLRPIPQSVRDRDTGGYPQNPGY